MDEERRVRVAVRQRAATIATAFDEAFFDIDAIQYGPGTQSSDAVPLFVGLVPDNRSDQIASELAEKVRSDGGRLRTGFLGTRPLIHSLVDHGFEELAYEVVSQPERPGWVYGTTGHDDHVGALGLGRSHRRRHELVQLLAVQLRLGVVLGGTGRSPIRRDDGGGKSVTIEPAIVDELEWVDANVETVDGWFASRWERNGDGLVLEVEIPWNTDTTVRVPCDAGERVSLGDEPVWNNGLPDVVPDGVETIRSHDGTVVAEIGLGSYRFEVSSAES